MLPEKLGWKQCRGSTPAQRSEVMKGPPAMETASAILIMSVQAFAQRSAAPDELCRTIPRRPKEKRPIKM
jgi:hypothetical protein